MKTLFSLIPIWVKISVVLAILGAVGLFIDNLCNSEKRSLRDDIVNLKKEKKTNNDTILKLRGKIKSLAQNKRNENFDTKMECKKEIKPRTEYEEPHIDAAGNLYF